MTTEAQKSMRALNGFLGRCTPHRREWAEEAQTRSDEFQELIGREPDLLDDLAQQIRRDVTADVEWHSRDAAIRVAELLMRSTLANFHESELPEDADNFSRFENRELRHFNLPGRAAFRRTQPRSEAHHLQGAKPGPRGGSHLARQAIPPVCALPETQG